MPTLLTLEIRSEQDIVMTRQRTRQIADLLGFEAQDQTRLATAVSEISRNAFQYAEGGRVEFSVNSDITQTFEITIQDKGKGIVDLQVILNGRYTSTTGMGMGIIGSQRLMDQFEIQSTVGKGTTVRMGKNLPKRVTVSQERLSQIVEELVQRSPQNPLEEVQWQNQELLHALEALRQREEELTRLNQELEDTNRGVVSLYAELDEKADSLQKANELKTRFLSNMSHEFRTPLNSIVSLSGMLLERMDGELTPEQEKQVTFIRRAAGDLSELVNDLLDLAKVEAGKVEVYPTAFEVSDLFGTLRGMLRPLLAPNSSIALIFEEPIDIPPLHTDEGKVSQILRNFISNALKYTPAGEVRVSAVRAGDFVTFSVADTGIGIAPEHHDRVFEEYIQIESPLQQRFKGTGLGLPLSQRLAQLLGGSVSVTSALGVGSTFSATIPILFPGYTPNTSTVFSVQLDPTRSPILVIEDQADVLFVYEKYLESSCYQFIPAQTLEEAEQALQMFQPSVVMLDILLKDQNTWVFLAELKENEATRQIPVVVATVIDNEQKAIALGADAFLIKPLDRFLLLNTLNRLVKREQTQTLLLIDDDPAARYVLKSLLGNVLCSISEAASGEQGIQKAQVEQPAAIVLDLVMPGMNGTEVLKQLKSNPTTAHIPVVLQTSQVIGAAEQKRLQDHTIAILSKERPAREAALVQLREALLNAGFVVETLGDHHA
jgi:signal transduction histidine kinase/CheY-like chemotaxis protein